MNKKLWILQATLMVSLFAWWQFTDDVGDKLNVLFFTSWFALAQRL
jgi:hypothetical protein